MNTAFIVILALLVLSPIMAFIFIKPDGRYHCHVPGCNDSFETIPEFIKHLKTAHNFNDKAIDEVMYRIKKYR